MSLAISLISAIIVMVIYLLYLNGSSNENNFSVENLAFGALLSLLVGGILFLMSNSVGQHNVSSGADDDIEEILTDEF